MITLLYKFFLLTLKFWRVALNEKNLNGLLQFN